MGCENCAKAAKNVHHGGYSYTCFKCRERLLMDEPCKLMRQAYVKTLERWGEVPEWKREPSCGCGAHCKRRQYINGNGQQKGEPRNAKF